MEQIHIKKYSKFNCAGCSTPVDPTSTGMVECKQCGWRWDVNSKLTDLQNYDRYAANPMVRKIKTLKAEKEKAFEKLRAAYKKILELEGGLK